MLFREPGYRKDRERERVRPSFFRLESRVPVEGARGACISGHAASKTSDDPGLDTITAEERHVS
jgi:hypothetical protein